MNPLFLRNKGSANNWYMVTSVLLDTLPSADGLSRQESPIVGIELSLEVNLWVELSRDYSGP
jgi:hypothetical protein